MELPQAVREISTMYTREDSLLMLVSYMLHKITLQVSSLIADWTHMHRFFHALVSEVPS